MRCRRRERREERLLERSVRIPHQSLEARAQEAVASPGPSFVPKAPAPPAKPISCSQLGVISEYGADWSFERMLGKTEDEQRRLTKKPSQQE
jgi:hypothetical protein